VKILRKKLVTEIVNHAKEVTADNLAFEVITKVLD